MKIPEVFVILIKNRYLYLPLYYNNKKPIEKAKFVDAFNEISLLFGGCSAEKNTRKLDRPKNRD